jgi:hypothetical protein
MFLSQVNRFRFGPKILVRSKAIWFGLEIVLGKIERFYIIQKLIDQNKTLWFDPLIIGSKAKHFDLVRLLSERKKTKVDFNCFCFFYTVADLTYWRFCYDKTRELKFTELAVHVYIQRLAENLVQKGFFVFETCRFEIDAYMYVLKTCFCAFADLT